MELDICWKSNAGPKSYPYLSRPTLILTKKIEEEEEDEEKEVR